MVRGASAVHAGIRKHVLGMAIAMAFLPAARAALAADCLACHGNQSLTRPGAGSRVESLYVDGAEFERSAHGPLGCEGCHTDIQQIPHRPKLAPVDCGMCHEDVAQTYQWHGAHRERPGDLMPACHDCHTKHDILAASAPRSTVNPLNLPGTCNRCHADPAIVSKYFIPMVTPVKVFEESVHWRGTQGGHRPAASCIDCHSMAGTSHAIRAPIDPASSIYHFNIPSTCGRCHAEVMKRYREGIHGQASAKGETDSPVCTGCHGDHHILAVRNPESRVSPTKVSMDTCAPCHRLDTLAVKYGFPPNLLQTWLHSYHGLKSTDGDRSVANCSSCHRAHLILPQHDPQSSVAPTNRRATCARCHPSITAQLANIPIHGTPGIYLNPPGQVIRDIYIVAILVIIGAMFVHWQIDLFKKVRLRNRQRQIVRMRRDELWQHTMLMVTFTVLAITGLAFHYSGSWWAKLLFGWEGGFQVRHVLHRVAGVLFIATALWHAAYLFSRRGRQFSRDIFPRSKDFRQFAQTMAYDLGLAKEPPRFGRFSYIEKAEYWALVWGAAVMSATGLLLWFGEYTERVLKVGALGVMLVIHFYETVLATLAILIWHLYSTIFNPPVFPQNPAWYTGKMPLDMYRHEHPDDPALQVDQEE